MQRAVKITPEAVSNTMNISKQWKPRLELAEKYRDEPQQFWSKVLWTERLTATKKKKGQCVENEGISL